MEKFKSNKLDEEQSNANYLVNSAIEDLSNLIDDIVPGGNERLNAQNKLEEVRFWSNASISRNGVKD